MKITLSIIIIAVVVMIMNLTHAVSEPDSSESHKNKYRKRFESTQKGLTATGAGGCSSTNCHGGATPLPGEVFFGNEWDRWYHDGKGTHFRAYKTLYEDERSDRMVKILYGPNAVAKETPQCLACHALNIPPNLRGRAFDIEDGVSCEACHGRSQKWLSIHTNKRAWRDQMTDEQRLDLGFYDLRNLIHRAQRCLECHLGTESKKVDHTMLAAGHPPLTFELSGDLDDVPLHWRNEQSFLFKGEGGAFQARVWAVGQVVSFRESMYRLIHWASGHDIPDYAFFECYACHHDLKIPTWRQRRAFLSSPTPGEAVWDIAGWTLCKPVVSMLMPQVKEKFQKNIDRITRALSIRGGDRAAVHAAATELASLTDSLSRKAVVTQFDRRKVLLLLRMILKEADDVAKLGYHAASQVFLAMETLYLRALIQLGPKPQNHDDIYHALAELHDMLYDEHEKERSGNYDPFIFVNIVQNLNRLLEGI